MYGVEEYGINFDKKPIHKYAQTISGMTGITSPSVPTPGTGISITPGIPSPPIARPPDPLGSKANPYKGESYFNLRGFNLDNFGNYDFYLKNGQWIYAEVGESIAIALPDWPDGYGRMSQALLQGGSYFGKGFSMDILGQDKKTDRKGKTGYIITKNVIAEGEGQIKVMKFYNANRVNADDWDLVINIIVGKGGEIKYDYKNLTENIKIEVGETRTFTTKTPTDKARTLTWNISETERQKILKFIGSAGKGTIGSPPYVVYDYTFQAIAPGYVTMNTPNDLDVIKRNFIITKGGLTKEQIEKEKSEFEAYLQKRRAETQIEPLPAGRTGTSGRSLGYDAIQSSFDFAWSSVIEKVPDRDPGGADLRPTKLGMYEYYKRTLIPLIKTGEFWKLPYKGQNLGMVGNYPIIAQTDLAYDAANASTAGNWRNLAKILMEVVKDRYSQYYVVRSGAFNVGNMKWKSWQDYTDEWEEGTRKQVDAEAKAQKYVRIYITKGVPTRKDPYNPDNYILFNHTPGALGWSNQTGYEIRDKGMPEIRKQVAAILKAGSANIPSDLLSHYGLSAGSTASTWEDRIDANIQQMETTDKLVQTYKGYARGGTNGILITLEKRDWEELAEAVLWSWTARYSEYLKKVEEERKKREEPKEPEKPKPDEKEPGLPPTEPGLPYTPPKIGTGWLVGGGMLAAGAITIGIISFMLIRRKRK